MPLVISPDSSTWLQSFQGPLKETVCWVISTIQDIFMSPSCMHYKFLKMATNSNEFLNSFTLYFGFLFCFDWILWIFLVFLNRLHSPVKMLNMFSWEYYFNFTNYFLFSLYLILNNKSQWINYIIIPEIDIICGGKTTRCFVALVGLSHFKNSSLKSQKLVLCL